MATFLPLDTKNLSDTFEYRDGGLYRKIPVRGSNVGARFGSVVLAGRGRKASYRRGKFNGADCQEHRLIWELLNGTIPKGLQIDHIDHDGLNNSIGNLRLVTAKENSRNKPMLTSNKSGITGVHWSKEAEKWNAQIKISGKSRSLGYFESIFDAAACRISAKNKENFHQLHGI